VRSQTVESPLLISANNAILRRPRLTAEQMRADIATFRTNVMARDHSF